MRGGPRILSQGAGLNASYGLLVRDPLERLAAEGLAEHRPRLSGQVRREDVAWAEVLVFLQSQENIDLTVLAMARHLGKKIVFVADDDYLDIPPGHMKTRHFEYPHRRRNYVRNIRGADTVLVATGHLAGVFAGYRGGEVRAAGDLPVADLLLAAPPNFSQDGLFRFVYATCPANYRHLRESGAAEAVKRITATHGGQARFIFMGGGDDCGFDPRFCQFIPQLPLEAFFQQFSFMTLDCGLAPLMGDSYSLGKSDLKYREYAARGLAGIYSRLPVYTRSVEEGRTGLLVENGADNWRAALTWLLEHRDQARQMGLAARRAAEERFTMGRWAAFWLDEIIKPLLAGGPPPPPDPVLARRGARYCRRPFLYEGARRLDAVWCRIRTLWYNAFYLDRYPKVTAFLRLWRFGRKRL